MISSGLMICSFFLRKRFGTDLYCLNDKYKTDVCNFDNVIDMLMDFCLKHATISDDIVNSKVFAIEEGSAKKAETNTYRTISFVIRSGAYGVESDIVDVQTEQVKYKRKSIDADIKRFACLVLVPKDVNDIKVNKGIIIFQTISSYGVKTISTKYLRTFFSAMGMTFETRSVSARIFMEKLINTGALYKLTLINNKISPDKSDSMLISSGREEKTYLKPQLKQTWKDKFLNIVEKKSETDILEFGANAFDDVRVTFKLGEHYRTVTLSNIDKFSVVEELPDSVYKKSLTDENVLLDYMTETALEYKDKMVFAVNNER